jgi:RNA polymerase sigma-70 factor (ECF subfamily)
MIIDSDKFSVLLKPHYNDALKYSRALCATWSADDAEDVLQQSFLLALENFSSLRDHSKFRSWFFKIITTTFYSSIRKHFWKKFLPSDSDRSNVHNIPDVFNRSEQTENRMVLNKALAGISAKERTAILLFELGNFSIEEITAIQGEKSISAVKSRLSRARAKLRKFIDEEENYISPKESSIWELNGDLENETIKLITEIRTER